MKKMLLSVITILLSTLLIAAMPTEADAAIYEDTIRLHILANSDSEADQALKLEIRDRVLAEYGEILTYKEDVAAAEEALISMLPKINESVNEWLCDSGYTASTELVTEWYDTRYYEDFTLPQGYYRSVKIEIGDAAGKNWWCVMYPPMCLGIATEGTDSYTESEIGLITGKYNVKFKILELISQTLRKK